jgi:hypothetical protein
MPNGRTQWVKHPWAALLGTWTALTTSCGCITNPVSLAKPKSRSHATSLGVQVLAFALLAAVNYSTEGSSGRQDPIRRVRQRFITIAVGLSTLTAINVLWPQTDAPGC